MPSTAQIAFALVVLKSKPPTSSIEDFIKQIRSTILSGPRKEPRTAQPYVDGPLFWKQAYEKLDLENGKLLDKISELEHRIERDSALLATSTVTAKRKAEAGCVTKANIQTKRRKVEVRQDEDLAFDDPVNQPDSISAGLNNIRDSVTQSLTQLGCRTLTRAIYTLRLHPTAEMPMVDNIKIACHLASQSIESFWICTPAQQPPFINAVIKVDQISTAIKRFWICLLDTLGKLDNTQLENFSSCISSIVHLFQTLLGQIQQHSLDEADQVTKAKSKQRRKPVSAMYEWKDICSTAARSCCHMLAMLDMNKEAHIAIYEGFMCALLDHVGSSLSLLVFADPSRSIKAQHGLSTPCGLIDVAHIDTSTALLTSQLAAPYLTFVLQKGISMADGLNHRQRSALFKTAPNSNQKIALINKFREKLQNTLLRGIYGDDDDAFQNSLARTGHPDKAELDRLLNSRRQANNTPEWFIGQVWETLGWDILAKDSEQDA